MIGECALPGRIVDRRTRGAPPRRWRSARNRHSTPERVPTSRAERQGLASNAGSVARLGRGEVPQDGLGDDHTGEVGAREVGACEVDAREAGAGQLRVGEVGVGEICAGEILLRMERQMVTCASKNAPSPTMKAALLFQSAATSPTTENAMPALTYQANVEGGDGPEVHAGIVTGGAGGRASTICARRCIQRGSSRISRIGTSGTRA